MQSLGTTSLGAPLNRIPTILSLACAIFLATSPLLLAQANAEKPSTASVKGTASYEDCLMISRSAVFEATLADVSKADAPAEIIATARITDSQGPFFDFSLDYDPGRIVENHSYVVRATITNQGKVIFTSTDTHAVITLGHPQEVNIILHNVAANSQTELKGRALRTSPQYLVEHSGWTLIRLGNDAVPPARTILSQTLNSTRRTIASEAQAAAIA
jgi:putative lipoprotein